MDKWTMRREIGVLVARGLDVEIFLRICLGFQSLFRDREQPSITFQRSLKDQMDHGKGFKGPMAQ